MWMIDSCPFNKLQAQTYWSVIEHFCPEIHVIRYKPNCISVTKYTITQIRTIRVIKYPPDCTPHRGQSISSKPILKKKSNLDVKKNYLRLDLTGHFVTLSMLSMHIITCIPGHKIETIKLECFQCDTTTTKWLPKRGYSRDRYLPASLHLYTCVFPRTYYCHYPEKMSETSRLHRINVPRLALPGKMDYRETLCQAWQQVDTSKEDICETLSLLALPINTTGRRRAL